MSPRKRVRPNPTEGSFSATGETAPTPPANPIPADDVRPQPDQDGRPRIAGRAAALRNASGEVRKSRSWYGSWPRASKSAASTQVARETILGGTLKPSSSPDFSRYDTRRNGDASSLEADSNSAVAPSSDVQPSLAMDRANSSAETAISTEVGASCSGSSAETAGITDPVLATAPPNTAAPNVVAQRPASASGWLGWFSKAPAQEAKPLTATGTTATDSRGGGENVPHQASEDVLGHVSAVSERAVPESEKQGQAAMATAGAPAVPWYSFWSTPAPDRMGEPAVAAPPVAGPADEGLQNQVDAEMGEAQPESQPTSKPEVTPAGSTWAFWSRDTRSKATEKTPSRTDQGELAVIGESSEAHPKPATGVEIGEPSSTPASRKESRAAESPTKESTSRKGKRLRPRSMDIDEASPARPGSAGSESSNRGEMSKGEASRGGPNLAKAQGVVPKPLPPNLLLPPFANTYRLKENPSILRQVAQVLLRTQQPPANHVFLANDPPKIKKAVAIGVHGLFPAAYLRPMIGQPTGTSIRFANHCAEAIRRWADGHGCEDCEIEKVALEGEGKIADRVSSLWKLLLNWADHIRSADLVILACHSQGVPVGIMLVAKLIELGITTAPKIGVCAMAGVSLGPFPDYKSGLGMLMGTATELWDFADRETEVSKRYEHSLKAVLRHGVRITYVGSIDDQVVPMESAIYSPAHHPYIYRAVFIDGRIHAPDFIAHLVGFACKLRNLGVSDHGLIRELSIPLAGSLYSGEGHSRLYDDHQVYDLAVAHTLETTSIGDVACQIQKYEGISNPNPYHLPWIMRGLLEEDFVKTELSSETAELLRQFDNWKPVTKALKDVKYRLEAVRSKL